MGIFTTYINPFDDNGDYTSNVDVSKDVENSSLSAITQSIDSSEYELGVFKYSNQSIKFNNKNGKYSDVETFQSIFRYKRADSIVTHTYQINEGPFCGDAFTGEACLSEEVVIFKGLVNDESLVTDIRRQDVTITVLGFESMFGRTLVPFDTLADGDTISEVLFKILNQNAITDLMSVSVENLTPALDLAIDTVAWFENKTVKQALDKLLLCANSVLYIRDDTVYVTNREPSASIEATFYGQASALGAENISTIKNLKNGVSRVYNFVTWKDTTLAMTDSDSVIRYGVRKVELEIPFFTDNAKRDSILQSIIDEFAVAKQEFDIVVPLTFDTLALQILDRIAVDYPTVYVPGENEIPICGVFEWDEAVLPEALWTLTISVEDNYKIISKKIDIKNQNIEFRVRKI
jgi:hypothetical protein